MPDLGRVLVRFRRLVVLLALGWLIIFVYEGVRQAVNIGDVNDDVIRMNILGLGGDLPIKMKLGSTTVRNPSYHSPLDESQIFGDTHSVFKFLKKESKNCSNTTRPNEATPLAYDKWHVFRAEKHEVYTYSAYYDDRPENGLYPSLRLLVISKTINESTDTYCNVWYPGLNNPIIERVIVKKNGGGHKFHSVKYEQYFFTCVLKTSYPIPTHVTLTSQPCDTPTNFIPIFVPIRAPPVHEFAVCVPVAFWSVDPYRLVEWVEANRLLGVTEINVYHVNMSESTLDVLKYFQKDGILKLNPMPSVPYYMNTRSGNKIGSPISLNDCMYRNMYRYKWILSIDFDEIIVPQNDINYAKMIADIDKSKKLNKHARSYTFRNTYFWNGCTSQDGLPLNSMFLKNVMREEPNKFSYAAKSILDPRKCISVFNHYCFISFPVEKRIEAWTIDVNPSIARSHHYRDLYKNKKKTKCKELQKTGFKDNIMLRYQTRLSENVARHLKNLGMRNV